MIYCPECETNLDIDEKRLTRAKSFPARSAVATFEVVTVSPIELKQSKKW